jgi:hypothetical protein
MGFTADGLPLIGPSGIADGLTLAAGFNGGGFSWAPIAGHGRRRPGQRAQPGVRHHPVPARSLRGGWRVVQPFTAGEESSSAGFAVSLGQA